MTTIQTNGGSNGIIYDVMNEKSIHDQTIMIELIITDIRERINEFEGKELDTRKLINQLVTLGDVRGIPHQTKDNINKLIHELFIVLERTRT